MNTFFKGSLLVGVVLGAGVSGSALAQCALKVSLDDQQSPITVSVDGRYFPKRGTSVTVGDLPEGTHTLEIFKNFDHSGGRVRTQLVFKGKVNTYNGELSDAVYVQNVNRIRVNYYDMNAATQNRQQQGAMPGYSGGDVNRATPNTQPQQTNPVMNANPDLNAGNRGNDGMKREENTNGGGVSVTPVGGSSDGGLLSTSDFAKAKKKIATKNTDTEKLKEAKDVLGDAGLTTAQVAELTDLFSFESTKVEFIEWAYYAVDDRSQFSSLVSKLSNNSYKEEIKKFLQDKK